MLLNIFILILTLVLVCFASASVVYYIIESKTLKGCITKIVLFYLSFILLNVAASHYDNCLAKANKDVEIETIQIAEIYRQNDNNFVIETEDGRIYTITTNEVYTGDSNYIIKKHHKNVAKFSKLWSGDIDEYTYSLVVTDTNISKTPELID